ncbi:MAG: lipoprotein [Rudaea sp.]|nr:lipoprotein [Rudaea sp.]
MSRRIPSILLLLMIATTLVACGSKGALVMPNQQATSKKKHTPKAAPVPPTPATPAAPVQPTPASGDGSGPAQ